MTSPPSPPPITDGGITEADIANYLVQTPGFFERHAELLSAVQLASPHGTRAVSLQERQMEMLRERIRSLEQRIVEMIRHGQDNVAISERLHRFTRDVMLVRFAGNLPDVLTSTLKQEFQVPQVALRLWGLDEAHDEHPSAQGVDEPMQALVAALRGPWVGPARGIVLGGKALEWVEDGHRMQSVALLPLRPPPSSPDDAEAAPFGLLLLASPDATRFHADIGTDFLQRIGDIAAAGLARMLPIT